MESIPEAIECHTSTCALNMDGECILTSWTEDEMRRSIHDKIVNDLGIMPHTMEYREFQRALSDSCEEMLPERFPPQKITKLYTPMLGMNRS